MSGDVSRNLAYNIRAARELHGLSQQQMANRSGVPRPTWANLESGDANPTVSVLTRVAGALQVSLEDLVAPPRSVGLLLGKKELPTLRRGKAAVRSLLPANTSGAEWERIELKVGGHLVAVAHARGTREYLACEVGELELAIADGSWPLTSGDVLTFAADQKHTYRCRGDALAIAYSLVILP